MNRPIKINNIRLIAGCLALALFLPGCLSRSIDDVRIARYKPNVSDIRLPAPQPAPTETPVPSETPQSRSLKPLSRGDEMMIYLRGIPKPETIKNVVDGLGCINMPLIGTIKVEEMTTSKAESLIEKAYIDGGYYKKITVIIVAQQGEYFVRGEVKNEGKYPLSGDRTLLQAITAAGGYTDYAKRSRIKIIRGDEVLSFDAEKIEVLKGKDPLIKSGDIIIVPTRIFL